MPDLDDLPEWERVLAAERHLQQLVPGTVLVGGTAAALHAGHRRSSDGDHVLSDLRDRFDDVLAALESAAGWCIARVIARVPLPMPRFWLAALAGLGERVDLAAPVPPYPG